MMRTINVKGIEFETIDEAIQHTDAAGWGVAVRLAGRNFVVLEEEADRIAAMGVSFAYLCDHEMPNGEHRIVTVPVN